MGFFAGEAESVFFVTRGYWHNRTVTLRLTIPQQVLMPRENPDDRERAAWLQIRWVYLFPAAAMTNHRKLDGLKQQKDILALETRSLKSSRRPGSP